MQQSCQPYKRPCQSEESDGVVNMAGCPSLSGLHHTLLLGFLSLLTCNVTTTMASLLWLYRGQRTVTSSLMTSEASRSALECIVKCQGVVESCDSVAFDPAPGICYLQPTYRPFRQGDSGPPLPVYTTETVPQCKPSQAPQIANAHVTKWTLTSSSLVGDVSCDQDYVLSANVTSEFRCQVESGVWTTLTGATCSQFAWRNYTVKHEPAAYLLPRPAQVGLCVRLKGTPTASTRFVVNWKGSTGDTVLHVHPRLNWLDGVKTTVFAYLQNGTWKRTVFLRHPSPPFPFALDVPFEMVITAVSMYKFSIGVNGVHYADYTAGLPVTDVTRIMFKGDVSIKDLIISC